MFSNLSVYGENIFEGIGDSIDLGEIFGYVSDLFAELWFLVALAVAIPLTFYLARRIIGLIRGRG